MNETYITVTGRLVADPESRSTRTGVPFASFRVASTVRRLNPREGQYEDAGTSFYNVTAFRSLGANVAHSLEKGQAVVVHGRLRVNQWMRQDNTPATSVEIDAYHVGHDLNWGTTQLTRVTRPQVDRTDRMADDSVQEVMASLEEGGQRGTGDGSPGDPDTDAYEVQPEPTGVVAREEGERALSSA